MRCEDCREELSGCKVTGCEGHHYNLPIKNQMKKFTRTYPVCKKLGLQVEPKNSELTGRLNEFPNCMMVVDADIVEKQLLILEARLEMANEIIRIANCDAVLGSPSQALIEAYLYGKKQDKALPHTQGYQTDMKLPTAEEIRDTLLGKKNDR